jgi:serine/threonine protein kinase
MTWIDDRAMAGLQELVILADSGDVVGERWELRERIGEGAMAVVYAAVDRASQREVAIKMIRGYGDHDDARFLREVTALERLSHPAIVEYIAHGEQVRERYVVMERLVGNTLAERLRRGALSAVEALALGERIAGGLAAVHRAGVTHRDLKPANIFLVADSVARACLIDFGLARAANAPVLTRKGTLIGTPGYMAPEQVRGEADVGPLADVFALGCVLWECVSGRPCFTADDEEKLFAQILLSHVPALEGTVPPAFSTLVARMLEKDPSRRPLGSELLGTLGELADGEPRSAATGAGIEIAPGLVQGAILAGKYRVEGLLGTGGMGVVVAARHLELGTRVAVKLLHSSDAADRARFDREARAASRLESQHVARVLEVGRAADGRPFFVMEHLAGSDLADRLAADGPLPVETAVAYVLETCDAIAEAHALGIVHRDLKPSNLFVARRRDGSELIKVLDFGISKITEALDDASRPPTITDAKVVMGSVPYMSPEQLKSSSQADVRSDVWSLGIVLHELVTGRRPFEGDNAAAVAARIAASEPMRLRQARADAPAPLEEVILRCLEKEPSRRYANVAALARALAPLAPVRGHGLLEAVAQRPRTPAEAPESQKPAIALPRRWGARPASGLAVAIALLVSAAWIWPTSKRSSSDGGEGIGWSVSAPAPSPPTEPTELAKEVRATEVMPVASSSSSAPVAMHSAPPSKRPLRSAPPAIAPASQPPRAVRPASSDEIDLRDPALERR